MNTVPSSSSAEARSEHSELLRKLRVDFWTKRLEHTLTHTQTASQLIYLVDGAVLALLAFVVEKLKLSGAGALFLAIPIAFLALLNYYHAEIILRQRVWYNAIDKRIRETLDNEPELRLEPASALGGTHHIYGRMHKAIALLLFIAAVVIGIYAFLS